MVEEDTSRKASLPSCGDRCVNNRENIHPALHSCDREFVLQWAIHEYHCVYARMSIIEWVETRWGDNAGGKTRSHSRGSLLLPAQAKLDGVFHQGDGVGGDDRHIRQVGSGHFLKLFPILLFTLR